MKIRLDKFDKGVFYLEYIDEDLLVEPLSIKLISYSPTNLSNPFNIKIDIPSLSGVDKNVLSNFIDMKLPSEMSNDEIKYMLSKVKITGDSEYDDTKYIDNEIDYHKTIPPSIATSYLLHQVNKLGHVNMGTKSSMKLSINGLDLKFTLSRYRLSLNSTFNIIGKSNSLMNYYFEIIYRYMIMNLDELKIGHLGTTVK